MTRYKGLKNVSDMTNNKNLTGVYGTHCVEVFIDFKTNELRGVMIDRSKNECAAIMPENWFHVSFLYYQTTPKEIAELADERTAFHDQMIGVRKWQT